MNIRSIKVTAVRVPIIGVGHFARARRTHAARTLLRMECDDGVVGLGETRGTEAARIIRDLAVRLQSKNIASQDEESEHEAPYQTYS